MKVNTLKNLLGRIPNQEAEVTYVGESTVVVKAQKEKAYVLNRSGRVQEHACPACVETTCGYNVGATCEAFLNGVEPNDPQKCRFYFED